jgi:hypothetical protein
MKVMSPASPRPACAKLQGQDSRQSDTLVHVLCRKVLGQSRTTAARAARVNPARPAGTIRSAS